MSHDVYTCIGNNKIVYITAYSVMQAEVLCMERYGFHPLITQKGKF